MKRSRLHTYWAGFRILPNNPPLRRAGAYLLLNLITQETYIGCSKRVRDRLGKINKVSQRNSCGPKLAAALKQFGSRNFLALPLYYTTDGHTPYEVEAMFIQLYDSTNRGYNIAKAGGGAGKYGVQFTASMKAVCGTPQALERNRIRTTQSWLNPTIRRRRTIGIRQAMADPEFRARRAQIAKDVWIARKAAKAAAEL